MEWASGGTLAGVSLNGSPISSPTIGEVAERVGLSPAALRWYERIGLLEPIGRDAAGQRRYGRPDGWATKPRPFSSRSTLADGAECDHGLTSPVPSPTTAVRLDAASDWPWHRA
ncbi:MAG TPA: MerR family DNA-binding transcriptional regulator [Jiangellales bacterium]|nr:MerR family DNA-binding transcriptional regulator [Jiangellales bacterium]